MVEKHGEQDWLHDKGLLDKALEEKFTLLASRGKFTLVCMELDLTKPLKAGYWMQGQRWKVQYEGLHELCFHCGKYGQRQNYCPVKLPQREPAARERQPANLQIQERRGNTTTRSSQREEKAIYGAWMIVTKDQ